MRVAAGPGSSITSSSEPMSARLQRLDLPLTLVVEPVGTIVPWRAVSYVLAGASCRRGRLSESRASARNGPRITLSSPTTGTKGYLS